MVMNRRGTLIERLDSEAVPVLEVKSEAFRQTVDADLLTDLLEAVEDGGRAGGFSLAIVLARAQGPAVSEQNDLSR